MSQPNEQTNTIKKTIEDVIGAGTTLKRRKKTERDINKEKFEQLINTLEEVEIRSTLLDVDFQLGFSKYDEKFYSIIDTLIELYLGKNAFELVNFYLFNRINPDGTTNHLSDKDGNIVPLDNPIDLWNIINESRDKEKA
jgi:hypothetical protein